MLLERKACEELVPVRPVLLMGQSGYRRVTLGELPQQSRNQV